MEDQLTTVTARHFQGSPLLESERFGVGFYVSGNSLP